MQASMRQRTREVRYKAAGTVPRPVFEIAPRDNHTGRDCGAVYGSRCLYRVRFWPRWPWGRDLGGQCINAVPLFERKVRIRHAGLLLLEGLASVLALSSDAERCTSVLNPPRRLLALENIFCVSRAHARGLARCR